MKRQRLFILLSIHLLCSMSLIADNFPQVLLSGDYPDPTIIQDGNNYYMTHSAFVYNPGFLIWHSTDLFNWKPIARTNTNIKGSAYAPDLVKHDEIYYIYYSSAGSNGSSGLRTSKVPGANLLT